MWHADHTSNQTGNFVCDLDGAWKARSVDPAALGKTGLAFGCDDCGTVDTNMADGTVKDFFNEEHGSVKRAANQVYYQCNYAYDVAVRTGLNDAFVTKLNADTGFGGYNDDRHVRGVCVCVCVCACVWRWRELGGNGNHTLVFIVFNFHR